MLGVGKLGLLKVLAGNLIAQPSATLRAPGRPSGWAGGRMRGTLLHLIYLAEACVLRGG